MRAVKRRDDLFGRKCGSCWWDVYRLGPAATIPLWHRLRALLPGLPRCAGADACPRCWEGDPRPRDEQVRRLAAGG